MNEDSGHYAAAQDAFGQYQNADIIEHDDHTQIVLPRDYRFGAYNMARLRRAGGVAVEVAPYGNKQLLIIVESAEVQESNPAVVSKRFASMNGDPSEDGGE